MYVYVQTLTNTSTRIKNNNFACNEAVIPFTNKQVFNAKI